MAEEKAHAPQSENPSVQEQRLVVPCGPNDAFRLKITIELERTPVASGQADEKVGVLGTDPGTLNDKTQFPVLGTDAGNLGDKGASGALKTKIHF